MILLWGVPGDEPIMAVRRALDELGAEVAFLDQRRALETEVELVVGAAIDARLRVGGQQLDLARVGAFYLRPYDSRRVVEANHGADGDSVEAGHAVSVEDVLVSWAEITPALVVSRPSDMAANNSKPYQAAQIRELGFAIPETLVTTDPEAAREFVGRHGEVVYKSVSSVRSIVKRLGTDEMDRLDEVRWCPTQFQRFVEGNDFRVHVVGDELFAAEIATSADDYRYARHQGSRARMRGVELGPELGDRCRRLAAALRLPVAGIDLRLDPEGRWYCFEVNPSPGYSFFQEHTGQRIDRAIARLLLAADRRGGTAGEPIAAPAELARAV